MVALPKDLMIVKVIVLFNLEIGLGEATFCTITSWCITNITVSFTGYLHTFLPHMYGGQFLREEPISSFRRSSGLSLLSVLRA